MAILITGGTGFIGASLARSLVQRGEEVVLFDMAPRVERISDIKEKVRLVLGDLKVWPEVLNVIKENNVEGIFHLGAMLSGASEENPWASFHTNVIGTMHVFEAARLFGVKRILFASTAATYALGTTDVITDETLQRPTTIYGAGKLFCELLGRFYHKKFGLDFRCLRFLGIVGPGAKPPPLAAFKWFMIENTALGKPYTCPVAEQTPTSMTYFKDGVRAAEMLYYAPEKQIKTMCYNVAGMSRSITAKDLELAVRKFIPNAEITFRPDPRLVEFSREFYPMGYFFDDSRAREEWGWEPLYPDAEKIVEDFIKEVRTRPQIYGLV